MAKGIMYIDGQRVPFDGEANVLSVIRKAGIEMPTFCYYSDLSVYGACRMCVVEDERGKIETSCSMQPRDGLSIRTNTARLLKHRRMILELMLASHNCSCTTCEKSGDCHLQELAMRFGVRKVRFGDSREESQLDDSSAMLNQLAKIMSKFDIEEIKENPTLFGKLFGNLRKQLDKILDKYHTMGGEVDKIYVQLKQYESEIKQSNRKLNQMFDANVNYYHDLVKYILAGEQGCREISDYIEKRQRDMEQTGDNSIQFEIQSLNQALMMLEQRTQDLRIAENVAMQSIPMIKTMEFSNMNLVRKINSAFIITLPVFKQALAQAIMLKRQRIQAEAMSALDEKTNEMLVRNARNTVEQSKMTAQLASGSSIKIETLETTWRTIVTGIDETKQIQENARKQRSEDQLRLEQIKEEFNRMYHMPDKK